MRTSCLVVSISCLIGLGVHAQTNTFPASGNVGIGTLDPAFKLEVAGRAHVGSGSDNVSNTANGLSVQDAGGGNVALGIGATTGRSTGLAWYDGSPGSALLYTFGNAAPLKITASSIYMSTSGVDRIALTADGRLGVGTNAPAAPLTVRVVDNDSLAVYGPFNNAVAFQTLLDARTLEQYPYGGGENRLLLQPLDGNVGIGATNPAGKLTMRGVGGSASSNGIEWQTGGNVSGYDGWSGRIYTGVPSGSWATAPFIFAVPNGSGGEINTMTLLAGNVGIGVMRPSSKLEVNGAIRAKEVIVETAGWSDYVFAPGYHLAPLSEVEAHIAATGTLPGIPSAAEVAQQGVSVGEMQAKLLAKIEEMTLHLIALSKQVDAQANQLSVQSAEISALKAENAVLRTE